MRCLFEYLLWISSGMAAFVSENDVLNARVIDYGEQAAARPDGLLTSIDGPLC